jgi:hypothetical protein
MAGPQRPSRGTRGPPNRGALQIPQSGTRASPASPEIEEVSFLLDGRDLLYAPYENIQAFLTYLTPPSASLYRTLQIKTQPLKIRPQLP